MSGNRNRIVEEEYKYCSLESDNMDKIQKRNGHLRRLTAVVIFTTILLFCLMNGMQKPITTELIKDVPDNFTVGRNSDYLKKFEPLAEQCTLFSLWILVYMAANFLHRVCLLMEELCHRKTRYNCSYKKLFIAVFYGSWNIKYLFVSVAVVGIMCAMDHTVVLNVLKSNILTLTMAVLVLLLWFTFKGWSDTEFEHSSACSPCIGIAMAYGAYYNYYQHVLNDLKERIEYSEKEFDINIPLKKLILLFPSSGNIQCKLGDGCNDLKRYRDLPEIKKDKGGTLDRKMTNPIYEVLPAQASKLYCVMEGVNCLSTLKGMNLPEEVFRQQAHLLYITLRQILNGSPYNNSYVLLCYDDENESLSNLLWIKHEELLNDIK